MKSRLQSGFPYPLYHGTSTHYLSGFQRGHRPCDLKDRTVQLELFRTIWKRLAELGEEPEWWIARVLEQGTGHSNWQHGNLYLTPSRISARRYAESGASCGGELMTMAAEALARLNELDATVAAKVSAEFSMLGKLLEGGGRPVIVTFESVLVRDLSPEREGCAGLNTTAKLLKFLESVEGKHFDVASQQANFRLRAGAGVISDVEVL